MSNKKKVEVVINGQTHGFMIDGDEELVFELADYVNKKILEVSELPSGKLLPNDKKYVFTAMNMAEELFLLRAKYEEAFEKRNDNYDDLKEKYNALLDENKSLREKIEGLTYEFDFVESVHKQQKEEYEKLKLEYSQLEQLLEKETAPVSVERESGINV